MRAIFGNSCAKGCFILTALFVLVVVVTTMGLGGLRARFGAAEVQGVKPGMTAQGGDQSAAAPQTQPQLSVATPLIVVIIPDGSGGGVASTATAISAPPPPITQPEPQPQPQTQPTAAVPASVESQGGTITGESTAPFYIVQSGDSVWQIAHKFGVDMDDLRIKNNIEDNLIYPGQVVYLPDPTQPSSPAPASTPDPGAPSTGADPDTGTGGVTPDAAGAQAQDPLVPAMPNTGITSQRP